MIQAYIQDAATYTELDPFLLSGLVSALVALLGQKTVKWLAGRIAGNHLVIGEVATEVLKQLDHPDRWDVSGAYVALQRPGRSAIKIEVLTGAVTVGVAAVSDAWNRLERRAVRVQARAVKAALVAAQARAALAQAVRDLAS